MFRTAMRGGFLSSFSVPAGGMRMRLAPSEESQERMGREALAKVSPQFKSYLSLLVPGQAQSRRVIRDSDGN